MPRIAAVAANASAARRSGVAINESPGLMRCVPIPRLVGHYCTFEVTAWRAVSGDPL
jgi:hypothetical protein